MIVHAVEKSKVKHDKGARECRVGSDDPILNRSG